MEVPCQVLVQLMPVCAMHALRGVVMSPSICGFRLLVQQQRYKKAGCSVFSPGCAGAYGSSYGSGYGGNSMYGSTSMYGGSGYGMNSGYGSGYGGSSLYGGSGFGEQLPSCGCSASFENPLHVQCACCGCSTYGRWRLWGAACRILHPAQQVVCAPFLLGCLSTLC